MAGKAATRRVHARASAPEIPFAMRGPARGSALGAIQPPTREGPRSMARDHASPEVEAERIVVPNQQWMRSQASSSSSSCR